jgi:hypothetical protein
MEENSVPFPTGAVFCPDWKSRMNRIAWRIPFGRRTGLRDSPRLSPTVAFLKIPLA